ncbi:MAG TPA: hypothetical protein VMB03_28515 [Bryobacteraceae bacterium]|nr:hypothetical protein [Bryobacteraceae bacterium]
METPTARALRTRSIPLNRPAAGALLTLFAGNHLASGYPVRGIAGIGREA